MCRAASLQKIKLKNHTMKLVVEAKVKKRGDDLYRRDVCFESGDEEVLRTLDLLFANRCVAPWWQLKKKQRVAHWLHV